MPHSLLAATVLFSGLILHYETNPATHQRTAYLIAAPYHASPRIKVKKLRAAYGFAGNATNGFQIGGSQYIIVPARTGVVTEDASFKTQVPHLKLWKLLSDPNADVHPYVKVGKMVHSHATVSYTTGTLGIHECNDIAIRFDPHDETERCLAEKVSLTFETDEAWEIREVGNPDRRLVIEPDGEALILNAAPGSAAGKQHQKHYSMLLVPNTTVVDDIVRTGNACNRATCHPIDKAPSNPADPLVECSNSAWP